MSTFDDRTWYTFMNPRNSDYALAAGSFQNPQGEVALMPSGTSSSENWQIFYQSGVYFIRNYDYQADYQLGLTPEDRSVPKMYPRSGALEQQWNILQVDDGYHLINGLWGNGTWLSMPTQWLSPAMTSNPEVGTWIITRNPSADAPGPKYDGMYNDVRDFEIRQTSSSSMDTMSTSMASFTKSRTISSSPASSIGTDPSLRADTKDSIRTGAITGGIIGGVVLLLGIFSITCIIVRRQHRRKSGMKPYRDCRTDLHNNFADKYAHIGNTEPPLSELCVSAARHEIECKGPPVELPTYGAPNKLPSEARQGRCGL